MFEVLTKCGLSFMVKMIREIILMPRADSGYPHNFMVYSWVFKGDEYESDAKTNSRHRVCSRLEVRSWHEEYIHSVCSWHIVSSTHTHALTHTDTHSHVCAQLKERLYLPQIIGKIFKFLNFWQIKHFFMKISQQSWMIRPENLNRPHQLN